MNVVPVSFGRMLSIAFIAKSVCVCVAVGTIIKEKRKNKRKIQRPRWMAEAFEIVYLYTRIQWDAHGAILIWFEPLEVIASERE